MHEDPTVPLGIDQVDRLDRAAAAPAITAWGDFTLLARVGFGGFGEVYRAWDPHLQREVALKLLLPGAVGDEAEYEAMLREARALASVRHPNIVPVYGIDRHNGRVGFWTDFVHGKTLSVLVDEQGTFGAREAALIGLDVTRALSAVHRAGLLHRDIKAENVMREQGGRILLMDFGLSSLEQSQADIAGTPNYMAPELFESGQSTVATDIYAMGVLLYYMVSGGYPARLAGLSPSEALASLGKRTPLMDVRPDLPESLLRTVGTATELDPGKRFASAGQLANALAESLSTLAPAEASAVAAQTAPPKGNRAMVVAGIAAVASVMIGFALWPGNLQRVLHPGKGTATEAPGNAKDEFQAGQELLLRSYKTSNLDAAVKKFQAVIQSDPTNALAEARLGSAYFIEYANTHDPKLLDQANEATTKAISLDAQLAPPYITLSRIAAMEGQTSLAMQYARKALDLEPRNAAAYGALGDVYVANGKSDDAVDSYQKAIAIAPDDWRWPVSLGVALFGQGNVDGAITQLKRGIELAPDNAVAYRDLSIAHMQSNRIDEARKDLESSLKIEPTTAGFAALGSVLLLEGKYDEAAAMEKRAIELNPKNYEAWADLWNVYQWSGKNKELEAQALRKSIELAEVEHSKRPQDPVLLVTLAENYAATGNAAKSLVLVRQAMALAGDSPPVEYRAGETYEALGQRDKAIPLIANAIARGYRVYEFERNPELIGLRGDAQFTKALAAEKAKNK